MPETADLARFYEDAYAGDAVDSQANSRWRALGAAGKADHVIALCRRARHEPSSTLDVGCGDGALLSELARRGFGGRLEGVEISAAAVQIASARGEIASVRRFDGARIPSPDAGYDLGILSHVLEHVHEPAALLAEVARACRTVVLEVPLERNLSAQRRRKRAQAQAIGHLQRLDRAAVREIVGQAGLAVACELEDPLPLAALRFFARSRSARVAATVKWIARRALHALAPALARRAFTLHYACLCRPAG